MAHPFSDRLLSLLVRPCAWTLRRVRAGGLMKYPRTSRVLARMGVLPIRNHYYEPYVSKSGLRRSLDAPRELPGLDVRPQDQLELLRSFNLQEELAGIPMEPGPFTYGYRNPTFGAVDAGLLYGLIRRRRPRRILEVGGGMSTLLMRRAIEAGELDCDQVCVEPFEQPWLEKLPIRVLRQPVEQLNPVELAGLLHSGDLLFIDSSHVVKPQGDVLFILQELLPRLEPGVWVHFHDIFTPRDYPSTWVLEARVIWAEQYLLESFLWDNPRWRIALSANLLAEEHHPALAGILPILQTYPKGILPGLPPVFPSSLYIRQRG